MTAFGMVTGGEKKHLSRGQPRPHASGVGLQRPQIYGTSNMHAHSMRNNNQIFTEIKLDVRQIFLTVDHEC